MILVSPSQRYPTLDAWQGGAGCGRALILIPAAHSDEVPHPLIGEADQPGVPGISRVQIFPRRVFLDPLSGSLVHAAGDEVGGCRIGGRVSDWWEGGASVRLRGDLTGSPDA